jgi:hypothetical protein
VHADVCASGGDAVLVRECVPSRTVANSIAASRLQGALSAYRKVRIMGRSVVSMK